MPEFSIIIATHNRARLLERSIISIQKQTEKNHQIIVISDSKDHQTYDVINKCLSERDIFIQRQGTPGPAESRNLGITAASGDYVIFLDDDDTFRYCFLSVCFCGCYVTCFDIFPAELYSILNFLPFIV